MKASPKEYRFRVMPEAQWYLVEALSNARAHVGARVDYEAERIQLSHFGGVLEAFRYLGAITDDEMQIWNSKMLVALGYEVPDPAPGTGRGIYRGNPAKVREQRPQSPSAPVFVRSQPGPDQEFEIHAGRLRVIAIEFYDSAVAVRWRVSPLPDVASAFPDEVAALEQDLVGLEEWAADDLRRKGIQKLAMRRLYRFGLSDDLDTTYIDMGSGHRGGGNEVSGEARFQAPPPEASVLVFSWLGLEVAIPIV